MRQRRVGRDGNDAIVPLYALVRGLYVEPVADGPDTVTLGDVERSIPVATAELHDGFFRVRTGSISRSERAYLRAMAELGSGPVRSSDVAKALGKDRRGVGPVRDALIKRALCFSPHWGEIAFTVPLFDQYMRRLVPSSR